MQMHSKQHRSPKPSEALHFHISLEFDTGLKYLQGNVLASGDAEGKKKAALEVLKQMYGGQQPW